MSEENSHNLRNLSIKKILIPVVKSEYNDKIISYAIILAKGSGASITAIHILDKSAQGNYGKSFAKCDHQQREGLLVKLSSSTEKSEKDFFTLVKSETINGFSTSKEVMLNYFHYKVAPGHYYGCVDVKA